MRAIQVRTSTVKALSFRTYHLDKQCKLRSVCSLGIGLIRVYIVAIPSAHCCRTAITVGQGPAVLAAGKGWKLFDFHYFIPYLFIFYFFFIFFFFLGGGGGGIF